MLLERAQALDAVAELVQSTAAVGGATLLVEGAAGTGKTALLAAPAPAPPGLD